MLSLLAPTVTQARQTIVATSDFRTWKDSTGVFSVEAKLLSVKQGKAELEKKDGLVVKLPLVRLSQADQIFVARQIAKAMDPANPFAGGKPAASKNPFENTVESSGGRATSHESKAIGEPAASNNISVAIRTKVDVTKNEVQFADVDWQVQSSKAGKETANVPAHVFAYPTSIEHAFHDRPQPPKVSHDGMFIAVAASNPLDDNTMVTVWDTQSGTEVGKEDFPIEGLNVFAVDSKNKQLIKFQKGKGREPAEFASRT